MTLETTRLDQALAVLDALEQPGPYPGRVSAAISSFSGFVLTGASDAVRNAMESFGNTVNAMIRRDPTGSGSSGTFPELSEEDARELAIPLRQVGELTRDVETERILARLRHHDGVLPEAEVTEARRHQAWFIPHLMRECRDQIAKLRKLDNPEDRLPDNEYSSLPVFSLFLFSEWNASESIPVVLEGLKLPGEAPFELFGDAVHELQPRYLAQFVPERLDQVDAIIRDPHANDYVRWSSAKSYKYLVRDQRISVDDAVSRLDRLFHETKVVGDGGRAGLGHCYELSAGILAVICDIGGSSWSTIPTDEQNWDFIDEWIIGKGDPDEPSGSASDWEPTARLLRLPPTRVEDCLEELRDWAAFRPRSTRVPQPAVPTPRQRPKPAASRPTAPNSPPTSSAPTPQTTRVPRNAPCPCGSGKKYKQCCLRKKT